ncbi:MAG TPA: hypothetical protein VH165_16440 [Kofleriaceae bacterium]|jgi:hypothetical protein|nr:hypothetical protein [Kofleriaceae bacterium]
MGEHPDAGEIEACAGSPAGGDEIPVDDVLQVDLLRERFGLDERNSATASRLIKEAVEEGAIVPVDEDAARKLMKYMPRWALESEKG